MDIVLYIDCDGVIFDTINEAYRMMDESGLDSKNHFLIDNFFKNVDWSVLFKRSKELNNAVNKIIFLKESNLFKDVIMLTKLSGNYNEEGIKRKIFNELLPGIRVITLQRNISKDSIVIANGNILVDDEIKNINSWNNSGGIGIFFHEKSSDFENNIISDLLDITKTSSYKKIIKTRF